MRDDVALLTERLGRPPEGDFEVVVRDAAGAPVVIRNAPFLRDGTPMPTRYWLCDPALRHGVAQLESAGGVRAAEAAVDPADLAAAHAAYAAERDAAIDPGHAGPRPSGGVGGTARGVKCLHAHYAFFLAGADDPVGQWVEERLREGRAPGGEPVAGGLAQRLEGAGPAPSEVMGGAAPARGGS